MELADDSGFPPTNAFINKKEISLAKRDFAMLHMVSPELAKKKNN
jgi:hypothetical protein